MIEIDIGDDVTEVRTVLDALIQRFEHPRQAMQKIGEHLTGFTKERFQTSTGPYSQTWEVNAQSTLNITSPATRGRTKNVGV